MQRNALKLQRDLLEEVEINDAQNNAKRVSMQRNALRLQRNLLEEAEINYAENNTCFQLLNESTKSQCLSTRVIIRLLRSHRLCLKNIVMRLYEKLVTKL